jgi:hypothetical protein
VNDKGLSLLREKAKTLYPDESRVVSTDDGPFHIEASPQASHGYLYIRARESRSSMVSKCERAMPIAQKLHYQRRSAQSKD